MTCRKWQFLLATAEACELVDNVALQEHLANCSECAQFARDMQALTRATRSLPRLSPSSEFGRNVRKRIDESMAATAVMPWQGRSSDSGTNSAWLAQPQAAVMALLALLALLMAYYQLMP